MEAIAIIISSRHKENQILLQRLYTRLESVLLGKRAVIHQFVTSLMAGGHVLLEDIPGVGKTLLASSFAAAVGGEYKRIQFTSDMLPADVIGGLVLDSKTGELVYRPGPIVANIVLADEINRTSPRTQSALLEVMEERAFTIDGKTRRLPAPFMIIATQNPLAFEGTSQLPEAQLDRFIARIAIGYPDAADELRLLEQFAERKRSETLSKAAPVLSVQEWLEMQAEARTAHVDRSLLEYMLQVAAATRESDKVLLGISPRAMRDWLRTAQASAYIAGRSYVIPDDLLETALFALPHRIRLTPEASYETSKSSFLEHIVRSKLSPFYTRSERAR
ncbi:AAA family ATPase [Paenibacillus sp. GXUN7292]|uniref:AAA family ATPase n=1 Tax=Paenibacillus sp. GXUN7292 TaxID=3422499 RepID=UPI003D7ED29E